MRKSRKSSKSAYDKNFVAVTQKVFAVLAAMVLVLALGAALLQLVRGGGGIDWWQLLSPFLLVAIPAMASIAAFAVLFETIPGLRGGLGNVVYFFCFNGLLATSFELKKLDFTGISFYMESMGAVVRQGAKYLGLRNMAERANSCCRRARFSRRRSSRDLTTLKTQPRRCRSDTIMARILSEQPNLGLSPSD